MLLCAKEAPPKKMCRQEVSAEGAPPPFILPSAPLTSFVIPRPAILFARQAQVAFYGSQITRSTQNIFDRNRPEIAAVKRRLHIC